MMWTKLQFMNISRLLVRDLAYFHAFYMNKITNIIGDIVEVQLPPQNTNPNQPPGRSELIVFLSVGLNIQLQMANTVALLL